MNVLKNYYVKNNTKDLNKWLHYFEIYEENFAKYKKNKITLLEIGVARGGSLKMWQNYFHKDSKIIGIDNNPDCKEFEKGNIKIFIGDQRNVNFLNSVIKSIGNPDIIIDDGGHTANQQITSFNVLYNQLKSQGIYVVEDTHSSYNSNFQDMASGFTFMDYAKSLSDKLNLWYQYEDYKIYKDKIERDINVPFFTKNTYKISFYNSMVVFDKRKINTPKSKIK